uniref:Uncharacterized protein n=1 Tax=Hucho hucho TaxID=62062 RepID=A0A4W5LGN0_9TELE
MADCNPWPRLVLSEHSSLTNLRAWTLKHVRNSKGLNTHTQPRTHVSGSKASPPKSFNTSLTSSASDTSLSHVRCNRHSSSSQTLSPQIHTSPSFTFGSTHNTHTQRGGSKALGPVRGKTLFIVLSRLVSLSLALACSLCFSLSMAAGNDMGVVGVDASKQMAGLSNPVPGDPPSWRLTPTLFLERYPPGG